MFNPDCRRLQVRVVEGLPDELGGGVLLEQDGTRWLFVEPRGDSTYWPDRFDPEAWKQYCRDMMAAGEPCSVVDLAEHFDVTLELALWGFQEYAADALLRMAAFAA